MKTPIELVQFGDFESLKNLVEKGEITARYQDADRCSLLHWAAINNRITIVKYLLSKGADINHVGGVLEEIPLQWAVRNNMYTQMVHLLITNGSFLNHRNIHGHDALSLAIHSGNVNTAYIL